MKKIALLAVAILAGVALAALAADPVAPVFYTEVQPSTRALPTGTCGTGGQGASLAGITALHLLVQCSDSSAITGGAAQAYFCDPGTGNWTKASSYNDFVLPTATGTLPDGGSMVALGPDLVVVYPFGRFLYALDGGSCAGSSWDGGFITTLARAQR